MSFTITCLCGATLSANNSYYADQFTKAHEVCRNNHNNIEIDTLSTEIVKKFLNTPIEQRFEPKYEVFSSDYYHEYKKIEEDFKNLKNNYKELLNENKDLKDDINKLKLKITSLTAIINNWNRYSNNISTT